MVAKGFPVAVIDAVANGASGGESYARRDCQFELGADGFSALHGEAIYMKRSTNNVVSVAMLGYVVQFSTARVVENFEETAEPTFADEVMPKQMEEAGWFSTNKKIVYERRKVKIGEKHRKVPIFKQRVVTAAEIGIIKRFLEYNACIEALRLGF